MKFKKLFAKFKNSFLLDNIKFMKEQNFNIQENFNILESNKFKIVEGDLTIKEVISEKIFLKNFKTLKRLNLMFLDQILTLDGKQMLTFNKLFRKNFVTTQTRNRLILQNLWGLLEDKIIERVEVNRNIKMEIFDKLMNQDIKNLKGFTFNRVSYDSLVFKLFIIMIKNNIIIYGKKYNLERAWTIIKHYITVNNKSDNCIMFKQCEGCLLNEKHILMNKLVYRKKKCLIANLSDRVMYIEKHILQKVLCFR